MDTIRRHWRSLIGLVMVGLALAFNWNWMWGMLFLFWVLPALVTGVTYFGEPIERKTSPVLFWVVVLLWLTTSAYLVAEPFLPPQYRYATPVTVSEYHQAPADPTPAVASGTYTDHIPVDSSKIAAASPTLKDSLRYKVLHSQEQHFIGIAAQTTYLQDQYVKDIEAIWAYFLENDISPAIPNIIDERVYLLYSDYDQPESGAFKITLGYRTADLATVPEGLEGLTVPPMEFAVFASEHDPEAFVARTWQEIAASDLPRANKVDLEVYRLDARTYDLTHAEVRISTSNN